MKRHLSAILACATAALVLAGSTSYVLAADGPADRAEKAGPFEPNMESLAKHNENPEWFRDAKFGIYFHWGVYSVPAFGSEWYPRNMHIKKRPEYKHHVETYGDPVEYGYDKFVPQFKAEKFDASEWADLFQKAGARFAGLVAEHHDGFAMWDSKLTPWNAKEKGPHRDLTGELAEAIRARGMKLIATFHHARNNLWEKDGKWTGHYEFVKKDFPAALENLDRAFLYGYMPREKFLDLWLGKLKEVVDAYQPDIMWFDSWLHEIPDEVKAEYLAHYFNRAREWGKEVVVTYKQQDLSRDIGVEDFEKGRADHLTDYVWLTDDTISRGSWCYTQDLTIKPTEEVLHSMIDIVSKNGVLLLNISPKANGVIPDNQKQVLFDMGAWLGVNGEAIYGTRPWLAYGEGPTKMGKGGAFIRFKGRYTPKDIRYTRSKDGATLYAIALGWPEDRLVLTAVQVDSKADAASVTLLGHDKPLAYSVGDKKQLVIELPKLGEKERPCQHAFAFKLTGFETSLAKGGE